ncbi:MAG: alpha/beta hydrolase [Lachnospiraceae bacterium]|nr:alpha/beta hydrolase [Lachnospiraceae bacterium]
MYRIERGICEKEEYEGVQERLVLFFHTHAMLYQPEEHKASSVGVVIMHCDANYMGLAICGRLADMGFTVLAIESTEGGEIEHKFEDLDQGVRFMKSLPGIEKIALLGHSGGATLITAYQAIAENGPDIFQTDRMIYRTTVRNPLEPADLVMLVDANYGNAVMALISLDPAVMEEGNANKLNPEFDLYAPENGYSPEGAHYSAEFIARYQRAQVERYHSLISLAKERLSAMQKGEGNYFEDEPFIIAAANQPKPNNRLLPQDMRLLSHTKEAHDLVHADGTVTHEIVRCVRVPEFDRSFSSFYGMGANKNTVKGFLSSQAIAADEGFCITEDDVKGIDWNSSYASPIGNIEYVKVPLLAIGLTGSYEYLAAEMICEHASMEDKTLLFIHGADHMFAPNRKAEKFPGEFGDTESALYNQLAGWLHRHE